MKAAPIVKYLQANLPRYSDKFSDTIVINEIIAENGIATATLATPLPTDFSTINGATVQKAIIAVPITSFEVKLKTIEGFKKNIAVVRTQLDHGMVLGFNFKTRTNETTAYMRGFANIAQNGDFIVTDVPNRFLFEFETALAVGVYPTDGTVLSYVTSALNGAIQATIIDSTHISYPVANVTEEVQTIGPCEFHYNIRIANAGDIEKSEMAYTNYEKSGYVNDKFWAFVVAENTTMSKDRNIQTDAVVTPSVTKEDNIYYTYEDFNVCVYAPVSNEILAAQARDDLEDVKKALFSTLLYFQPENQYACQNNYLVGFLGDNPIQLDRNRLARAYTFQCQYQLGMRDGNVIQGEYAPARDVELAINFSVKQDLPKKHINLDEFPNE